MVASARERLFVYGTLCDPAVQRRVIGRAVAAEPDALDGYRAGTVQLGSETYLQAIPEGSSAIEGLVLDLSDGELAAVDAYETSAYRRARVRLRSGRAAWACVRP